MRNALTINDQIQLLKSRGMIFNSENKAKQILSSISYYNIINAYKSLFLKNNNSEDFKDNTNFNEIYSMYVFDSKLRTLFLHYFLMIENKVRTKISYTIATAYDSEAYLHKNIYDLSKTDFLNCFELILKVYKRNKNNDIISHFNSIDENTPIWAIIDCFQFNEMREFYSNLNQSLKDRISSQFNLTSKQFKSILSFLNFSRNIAAHGNKFYNLKVKDTNKQISDLKLHSQLDIKSVDGEFQFAKNDLLAVLVAFKYLLTSKEFSSIIIQLKKLLNILKNQLKAITIDDVLNEMGFIALDSKENIIDWTSF